MATNSEEIVIYLSMKMTESGLLTNKEAIQIGTPIALNYAMSPVLKKIEELLIDLHSMQLEKT